MISSKSLKYTVRILLGTLIGVYLGIIVLLNIPCLLYTSDAADE